MGKQSQIKLGDRLRRVIEIHDTSQRGLAKLMEVGPNQVSRWISGAVAPSSIVMSDIICILRVKPDTAYWLITGKGKKPAHRGYEDVDAESEYTPETPSCCSPEQMVSTLQKFNDHLQLENARLKSLVKKS